MEDFYPSEIARLVLGYLHELKCKKSWQTFMEESSNLSEYLSLYKIGKVYSTNVNGNSLLDILSEYCNLKKGMKNEYKVECEINGNAVTDLENSNALSKEVIGQIVKNADYASQQYFISVCKDITDHRIENHSRPNVEEKRKIDKEKQSLNNLPQNIITDDNNEANVSLRAVNENVSFTSPQLSGVISLSNFNSSKIKTIYKDVLFNAEKEDEPVCLLETIKLEKPDPDIETINICEPSTAVHCKDSKSTHSSNVGESDAGRKSTVPVSEISLSNIQQDNDLNLNSENNVDLRNLNKLKNDLNNENQSSHYIKTEELDLSDIQAKVHDTSDVQNNVPTPCTSVCDGNNTEVTKTCVLFPKGTVIQNENVVNTLNSSSNQLTFTVPSNSFPTQCVSSDNVPTYVLSNFLSNSCFLINAISDNKMPLAVTGLPVNNISNHVFTPIDSRSNELSCTMPFPTNDVPILPAPSVVKNTKTSKAVAVDEKEHVKRMKLEEPSKSQKEVTAVQSAAAEKHQGQKAVFHKKKEKKKSKKTLSKVQNAKSKVKVILTRIDQQEDS